MQRMDVGKFKLERFEKGKFKVVYQSN